MRSRTETENAKSGQEPKPLLSQKDNKIKSGMELEGSFIAKKKVLRRNPQRIKKFLTSKYKMRTQLYFPQI
jgi:hypothetical protein